MPTYQGRTSNPIQPNPTSLDQNRRNWQRLVTGGPAVIGGVTADGPFNYPDGSPLTDTDNNLYYPNDGVLANTSGNLYYSNGTPLANIGGDLLYSNGQILANPNNLQYPNGDELADSSGNLYYSYGDFFLADAAGNLYYNGGGVLATVTGEILYSTGAVLADAAGLLYAPDRFLVGGITDDMVTAIQVDGSIYLHGTYGAYLGTERQFNTYAGLWFGVAPASTGVGNYTILTVPDGAGFDSIINATNYIALRIGNTTYVQVTNSGRVVVGGGSDNGTDTFQVDGSLYIHDTKLLSTGTNFANGAGSSLATMTNAPVAGNPTKWIPINDNGTIRHIPAW